MNNAKKKQLLEEIVEKYYGEDDIAKAHFFHLHNLDQYKELQKELSKIKKSKKRKADELD